MNWHFEKKLGAKSEYAVDLIGENCALRTRGGGWGGSRRFSYETGAFTYNILARRDASVSRIEDELTDGLLGPLCIVAHSGLPHMPWQAGEERQVATNIKSALKFITRHHPDKSMFVPIESVLFAPPPFCHLSAFSDA